MADGPRCQRRKQANPQRNNMTNYSNVAEASSDSDDEDKLHIVEEDSIPDGSDCHTSVPAQNPSVFQQNGATELHNGHTELGSSMGPDAMIQEVTIKVKEECVSEDDDEDRQEQGDAAGAQAPEDEQSTPERAVHDENGTPEFLQLHTCPYCSRGYKRYSSLKEHIKYRHEKSDDNYSCSLCTYTFSHRTQLDRHMTAHKGGREQRVVTQSGGNRKFSCSECSKAFKYKHHLKEHLRIHSGEKPYECSNCKKRFSHSGSYSSHISSKKCVGAPPMVNGLPHSTGGKSVSASAQNSNSGPVENPPTRILLREKVEPSKPLQEQLPITQIKQEPTEHQQKPLITTASTVATTTTTTTPNGGVAAVQVATNQGVVQTLVLPTVGLVQPISINLSDLQNVLKLAMEGNVRQGLAISNVNGGCAKLVGQVQSKTQTVFAVQAQQPQAAQLISAISLPVVDQDGTAKIIINYSMDPQLGAAKANPTQPNTVHPQPIQPTTALAQTKETQVNLKQPGQTKVVLAQATPVQSIVTQSKQTQPNKTQLMLAHSNIGQPIRLVQTVSGPSRLAQPTVFIVQRRVEPATQPSVPTQQAVEAKAGAEPDRTDRPKLSTEVACEPEDLTKPVRIKTEPASPPPPDVETEPEKGKDKLINGGQVGRTDGEIETEKTSPASDLQVVQSGSASGDRPTCLLCDEQPGGLDILHSTSRCAHNDGRDTNGSESVSLSSLLGKEEEAGGAGCPSLESLLALLKAYNQDTEPSEEELTNVAQSVGLPLNVVRRWYQRMRSGQASPQPSGCANQSQQVNVNGAQVDSSSGSEVRICQPENLSALAETHTCTSTGAKAGVPSQPDSPSAPSTSPLNLSATGLVIVKTEDSDGEGQDEPLDLSLPKPPHEANVPVTTTTQAEPLNLTCVQKEPSPGNTIYVTQPNAGPINIVATPLPTLVAIAEPSGVPCLRAISTQKRTILIPQLTYTYTTTSDGSSAANTPNTVILNSCQEEKVDTSSEGVSAVEEQNDSDSSPVRKRRRTQGGKYACDLCDKIFQKSSSLLRHKYEHTGRRPHECGICNKAFKHKHHLIEHTRLHSGEKPYQCDKCGKRFSHSGSYSQHMNHRYSYCKKEAQNRTDLNTSPAPPSQLDSDERESEEEDEEEERDQEGGEEDLSILDMDDIRVVRVGEEGSEGYGEELEEEDDGGMSEEQEHGGGGEEQAVIEGEEVMEVYLGDSHPPGEVGETTVMESTMEVVEGSGENVGMTEERNVTDSLENIETAKEGKTIG